MTRLRELHFMGVVMIPERSATTHLLVTQKRSQIERESRDASPPIGKTILMSFFCAPRPFGLSVLRPTFSLQVPQKAVALQPNGPGSSLKARSKSSSKDSAMPGGPSFKFNSDHIRDLLPGRRWAGGGGYVERKSDVFSIRI